MARNTQPMNPLAGVPGPGDKSVRNDLLKMGSTAYGEGIETDAIKSGAKLAKTPDVRGATNTQVRQAASGGGVGMFDNTNRPNEDIMTGADRILDGSQYRQSDLDIINKYMPALDAMAAAPDSPQSFRIFVRNIQGIM
jgi:hypothetical protein